MSLTAENFYASAASQHRSRSPIALWEFFRKALRVLLLIRKYKSALQHPARHIDRDIVVLRFRKSVPSHLSNQNFLLSRFGIGPGTGSTATTY